MYQNHVGKFVDSSLAKGDGREWTYMREVIAKDGRRAAEAPMVSEAVSAGGGGAAVLETPSPGECKFSRCG